MRELIYYVASTLDGFIARADGSFDKFPWDDDYGADLLARFPETFPTHVRPDGVRRENKRFDTVLMGRRTYEVGLRAGFPDPYTTLTQYVFSRNAPEPPNARIRMVRDNVVDTVRELKAARGKAIWLCGGAALASTLFSAGLIDKVIVKLNPVLFGSGIPLFGRDIEPTPLKLVEHRVYASGHAVLEYDVQRGSSSR
jgi:dihydrofolate reductase